MDDSGFQGPPRPAAHPPNLGAAVTAAANAAVEAATAPPPPYRLLDVRNSPVPLRLTWARDGVYPAAICVRKDFKLLQLVKFTVKADLTIPDTQFICGFSAKDTLLGGRFSANIPARLIEYRKKLVLPNGSSVAVSGGLQHVGERWDAPLKQQFRPLLAAQLQFGELGGGTGNIVYAGDGFHMKQRLPVPRRLVGIRWPRFELETYATLKVPQLTTRYSVQRDGLRRGVPGGFGEPDQEPLHLHIASNRFVVRL